MICITETVVDILVVKFFVARRQPVKSYTTSSSPCCGERFGQDRPQFLSTRACANCSESRGVQLVLHVMTQLRLVQADWPVIVKYTLVSKSDVVFRSARWTDQFEGRWLESFVHVMTQLRLVQTFEETSAFSSSSGCVKGYQRSSRYP